MSTYRAFSYIRVKQLLFLFTILLISPVRYCFGQQEHFRCGFSAVLEHKPHLKEVLAHTQALKTTVSATDYSQQYPIPVIFHIVLTQKQIQQLGGEQGIQSRIDSQMKVINADFNRMNGDSIKIPSAFKTLYANMSIRFGLAHTTPNGDSTPGYEIHITDKKGIELYSNYKSGVGFTEAKYTAAGGLDAWDPSAYLNIWVINPLENDSASRLAGLTIPPSYTHANYGIPLSEQGITLHYGAFGKRQRSTDYYLYSTSLGRTLTHELGHYFNLRHIWGDDEGACPDDSNGEDDGISDTPPQGQETYGRPMYPLYDKCTPTGSGIMFMNYMDYSDDISKYMFTTDQAARAQQELIPGGASYSLIHHPELLTYTKDIDAEIAVFPNPANEFVNVFLETNAKQFKQLALFNSIGQEVRSISAGSPAASYYNLSTDDLPAGHYLLKIQMENRQVIRRIAVRH